MKVYMLVDSHRYNLCYFLLCFIPVILHILPILIPQFWTSKLESISFCEYWIWMKFKWFELRYLACLAIFGNFDDLCSNVRLVKWLEFGHINIFKIYIWVDDFFRVEEWIRCFIVSCLLLGIFHWVSLL